MGSSKKAKLKKSTSLMISCCMMVGMIQIINAKVAMARIN